MAIAHHCAVCGYALTRVRVGLDPVYRLQVVACPNCKTACVRRRDPVSMALRRAAQLFAALAYLLPRVIATGILLAASWLITAGLLDFHAHEPLWDIVRGGLGSSEPGMKGAWAYFLDEGGRALMVAVVICGVCTGAWLAAAFSHVRPRVIVPVVFAVLLLGLPGLLTLLAAIDQVLSQGGVYVAPGGNKPVAEAMSLAESLGSLRPQSVLRVGPFVCLAVSFAFAPVGWLFGARMKAAGSRSDTRRFGRLRARVRKRRHHT